MKWMTRRDTEQTIMDMAHCVARMTEMCDQWLRSGCQEAYILKTRDVMFSLSKMLGQYNEIFTSKKTADIMVEPPEVFIKILKEIDDTLETGVSVPGLCKTYHTYPKKLQDQFKTLPGAVGRTVHPRKKAQARAILSAGNRVVYGGDINTCGVFQCTKFLPFLQGGNWHITFKIPKTSTELKNAFTL